MIFIRPGALLASALFVGSLAAQSPTVVLDLEGGPEPDPGASSSLALPLGTALGSLWGRVAYENSGKPWFRVPGGSTSAQYFSPLLDQTLAELDFEVRGMARIQELSNGRAVVGIVALNGVELLFGMDAAGQLEDLGLGIPTLPNPRPIVLEGLIVVWAQDASEQQGIYASDGTAAGTRRLVEVEQTAKGIALVGGQVVYSEAGSSPLYAVPLAGGERAVLAPEGPGSQPEFNPLSVGGRLVFGWRGIEGASAMTGIELWETDGTTEGTRLLVDLEPGLVGSGPLPVASDGATAFFSAVTSGAGRQLWRTDGTSLGTEFVADVNVPGPSVFAWQSDQGVFYDGRMIFRGFANGGGIEPYVTDGTSKGTLRLAELPGGVDFSGATGLTPITGGVVFSGREFGTGFEPYTTDGLAVTSLGDLQPGPGGSDPDSFVEFEGRIYFRARTTSLGSELWSSAGGQSTVQDLYPAPVTGSSNPDSYVPVAGGGYFLYSQVIGGVTFRVLAFTDGTPAGTRDLFRSSEQDVRPLGTFDQGLMFYVIDIAGQARKLYLTDGSPEGTVALSDGSPETGGVLPYTALPAAQLGGLFYYQADDVDGWPRLYQTDGTAAGTGLAPEFTGLANDELEDLERLGDLMWFRARANPESVLSLWRSDGTTEGTYTVGESNVGAFVALESGGSPSEEVAFGVTRVTSEKPTFEFELFKTSEGGDAVASHGTGNGRVLELAAANERVLVFSRLDIEKPSSSKKEFLLTSFGALGETLFQMQFEPASSVTVLCRVAGGVYFRVAAPTSFTEYGLWFSDGTLEGTGRVTSSFVPAVAPLGSTGLAFAGLVDEALGGEPHILNGLSSPPVLLTDSAPGEFSSSSVPLGLAGNRFLFSAYDPETGNELHGAQLALAGVSSVVPYGQGCGSGGFADLYIEGQVVPGTGLDVRVSDVAPLAPSGLYVAPAPAAIPLGSCTLYLGSPQLGLAVALTDSTGAWNVSLALPAEPALTGLELYLQAAVRTGPGVSELQLTNGVELVVGG